MKPRTILHLDLDAFYASVEQRDDPSLRGRPVIVGGTSNRGVVCAASYEARPFGVKSAMPIAEARRLCPHAVFLPVRMDHYAEVSGQFFEVLEEHTNLVEALSLDEAFLDMTDGRSLFGDGPQVAGRIKLLVRKRLDLVVSVGVAASKFVAKVASDLGKPDGLLVVPPGQERAFLEPLPVGRLWGVGKVTEAALREIGVRTIGDVSRVPAAMLARRLGEGSAEHLRALARGEDDRPVDPEREAVQHGHEETFEHDIHHRQELVPHLLSQADRVGERLRHARVRARTVTLKIKYADFRLVTRRATLDRATTDGQVLGKTAIELLARVPDIERIGVRLSGVSGSGLVPVDAGEEPLVAGQLSLPGLVQPPSPPEPESKTERLGPVLDDIRKKFGADSIRRAVHLGGDDEDM